MTDGIRAHVDLLGLLFMVWGGLNALLGTSLLSLGLGAAAMVIDDGSRGADLAVGMTAVMFVTVAILAVVWGGAHLWAGSALRRRVAAARLTSLGMAVLNLFVLPFGTALGAYTLWVLLNDRSRDLFEAPAVGRPGL